MWKSDRCWTLIWGFGILLCCFHSLLSLSESLFGVHVLVICNLTRGRDLPEVNSSLSSAEGSGKELGLMCPRFGLGTWSTNTQKAGFLSYKGAEHLGRPVSQTLCVYRSFTS